jgi:uncharacterized OB-fold protein
MSAAKMIPRQAKLVDVESSPPRLRGGECARCGLRFFPFQSYGCERCGAAGDELSPALLEPHGEVLNAATVHLHTDSDIEGPFTVATVLLEPGLALRGLLVGDAEGVLPGAMVTTKLVPSGADEDGNPLAELRFEVTE